MPGRASPPRYGAYLLRCWEVRGDRPGRPSTWRFSLEEAGTGERRAFRDLEALVASLREKLCGGLNGTNCSEKRQTVSHHMPQGGER